VIASEAVELTTISPDILVREGVPVSVAEMVWLPGVFKVAKKFPVPLDSGVSAGSTAFVSLLTKWIVPK
jgi:hypothetical protein